MIAICLVVAVKCAYDAYVANQDEEPVDFVANLVCAVGAVVVGVFQIVRG